MADGKSPWEKANRKDHEDNSFPYNRTNNTADDINQQFNYESQFNNIRQTKQSLEELKKVAIELQKFMGQDLAQSISESTKQINKLDISSDLKTQLQNARGEIEKHSDDVKSKAQALQRELEKAFRIGDYALEAPNSESFDRFFDAFSKRTLEIKDMFGSLHENIDKLGGSGNNLGNFVNNQEIGESTDKLEKLISLITKAKEMQSNNVSNSGGFSGLLDGLEDSIERMDNFAESLEKFKQQTQDSSPEIGKNLEYIFNAAKQEQGSALLIDTLKDGVVSLGSTLNSEKDTIIKWFNEVAQVADVDADGFKEMRKELGDLYKQMEIAANLGDDLKKVLDDPTQSQNASEVHKRYTETLKAQKEVAETYKDVMKQFENIDFKKMNMGELIEKQTELYDNLSQSYQNLQTQSQRQYDSARAADLPIDNDDVVSGHGTRAPYSRSKAVKGALDSITDFMGRGGGGGAVAAGLGLGGALSLGNFLSGVMNADREYGYVSRDAAMSDMISMGTGNWSLEAQRIHNDSITAGLQLERDTHGMVNGYDVERTRASLNRNVMGHYNSQASVSDAEDMSRLAQVSTLYQQTHNVSSATMEDAINTSYKELNLSLKETEYLFSKIDDQAASLNIPFEGHLKAVMGLAEQYKDLGFGVEDAINAMGVLTGDLGLNAADSAQTALDLARGVGTMDNGLVSYIGARYGGMENPYQPIAMKQNRWSIDPETGNVVEDQGYTDMMMKGLEGYMQEIMVMGGGDPAAASVLLNEEYFKNTLGVTNEKARSVMTNAAMQGNFDIVKDILDGKGPEGIGDLRGADASALNSEADSKYSELIEMNKAAAEELSVIVKNENAILNAQKEIAVNIHDFLNTAFDFSDEIHALGAAIGVSELSTAMKELSAAEAAATTAMGILTAALLANAGINAYQAFGKRNGGRNGGNSGSNNSNNNDSDSTSGGSRRSRFLQNIFGVGAVGTVGAGTLLYGPDAASAAMNSVGTATGMGLLPFEPNTAIMNALNDPSYQQQLTAATGGDANINPLNMSVQNALSQETQKKLEESQKNVDTYGNTVMTADMMATSASLLNVGGKVGSKFLGPLGILADPALNYGSYFMKDPELRTEKDLQRAHADTAVSWGTVGTGAAIGAALTSWLGPGALLGAGIGAGVGGIVDIFTHDSIRDGLGVGPTNEELAEAEAKKLAQVEEKVKFKPTTLAGQFMSMQGSEYSDAEAEALAELEKVTSSQPSDRTSGYMVGRNIAQKIEAKKKIEEIEANANSRGKEKEALIEEYNTGQLDKMAELAQNAQEQGTDLKELVKDVTPKNHRETKEELKEISRLTGLNESQLIEIANTLSVNLPTLVGLIRQSGVASTMYDQQASQDLVNNVVADSGTSKGAAIKAIEQSSKMSGEVAGMGEYAQQKWLSTYAYLEENGQYATDADRIEAANKVALQHGQAHKISSSDWLKKMMPTESESMSFKTRVRRGVLPDNAESQVLSEFASENGLGSNVLREALQAQGIDPLEFARGLYANSDGKKWKADMDLGGIPYQELQYVAVDNWDDVDSLMKQQAAAPAQVNKTATGNAATGAPYKGQYADIINKAAQKHGVDPNLIAAMIQQESSFNPNARSGAGAMGLMQLMPGTAKELGVTNAYDPEQNVMGGTKYIAQQLQKYNGDTRLALAAYNAGAGNVNHWLSDHGGQIQFSETQKYVDNIMGNYSGGPATTVSGSSSSASDVAAHYLKNYGVTSEYGEKRGDKTHGGVDLSKPGNVDEGDPIYSLMDGEIRSVGVQRDKNGKVTGAGNYITVENAKGEITKYFHLMKDMSDSFKVGQEVKAGDLIGQLGNTGTSSGAHLHLEYWKNKNTRSNPYAWLQSLSSGGNAANVNASYGGGTTGSSYDPNDPKSVTDAWSTWQSHAGNSVVKPMTAVDAFDIYDNQLKSLRYAEPGSDWEPQKAARQAAMFNYNINIDNSGGYTPEELEKYKAGLQEMIENYQKDFANTIQRSKSLDQ